MLSLVTLNIFYFVIFSPSQLLGRVTLCWPQTLSMKGSYLSHLWTNFSSLSINILKYNWSYLVYHYKVIQCCSKKTDHLNYVSFSRLLRLRKWIRHQEIEFSFSFLLMCCSSKSEVTEGSSGGFLNKNPLRSWPIMSHPPFDSCEVASRCARWHEGRASSRPATLLCALPIETKFKCTSITPFHWEIVPIQRKQQRTFRRAESKVVTAFIKSKMFAPGLLDDRRTVRAAKLG